MVAALALAVTLGAATAAPAGADDTWNDGRHVGSNPWQVDGWDDSRDDWTWGDDSWGDRPAARRRQPADGRT